MTRYGEPRDSALPCCTLPSVEAGKIDNGRVSNYPVWLVRVTGLNLTSHGPQNAVNRLTPNTQLYEFVDANNGQILFGVGMP